MKQAIHLATWDHKHGTDYSAHKSYGGALLQCVQWARETLESWGEAENYKDYTDSELISSWTQISGDTEFFKIEDIQLNN
tara:strand:- start:398 stop:637 length:240 start_codon:yes stop_codon:yes gene_type:complete